MSALASLSSAADGPVQVAALYRFTTFDDPPALRAVILGWCADLGIRGTLLLAREGINGTVSGGEESIADLVARLRGLPGCAELEVKYSRAERHPFGKMKVKLKREIVTMNAGELDPARNAGLYVEPQDWNALIQDPDTILIDTRNDYEVAVGTFAGAKDPNIRTFSDFPAWFAREKAGWEAEGRAAPKVAMFCTGGIRCEKSTAFARGLGLEQVYHLKGGILKYLEEIPQDQSLWQGNCFVFDERVSVRHGLEPSGDRMCETCGWPYGPGEIHQCAAEGQKKAAPKGGGKFLGEDA